MKVLASMIEYNGCKRCKSKIIRNSQYCKSCRLIMNRRATFLSYEEEQKFEVSKKRIKSNVWIISPAPIQSTYSAQSKVERNTYAYLKKTKFRDLEHFTSFIIKSKRVSYSQLIITLAFDLNSLPVIYKIVQNSDILNNTTDLLVNVCKSPQIAKNLQVIFQQSFWDELIKLYINQFHIVTAIFNLKHFNPKSAPPCLLAAIQYCGYQYYAHKTDELTEYIENFGKFNLKRILFKPSLANAQAILIYSYTLQSRGELSLARKYQSHLVHMCSALGIHIDCRKFDSSTYFNRRTLFLKLSVVNNSLNGALKAYLNYIPDLPDFDHGLYDSKWQLLPTNLSKYSDLDKVKRELISTYTTIMHKFCDQILYLLTIRNGSELNCKTFEQLYNHYTEHLYKIQSLLFKYPQYSSDLELFLKFVKLSFYDIGIGLLDELSLNPLIEVYSAKNIVELSDSILDIILCDNDENEPVHVFYHYYLNLVAISYLNCFEKLSLEKQLEVKLKFKRIINYLGKSPYFKFIRLILEFGLKLIN